MILYLLDSNFAKIDVVDTYNSFIWTDRYNEMGDFELVTSPNSKYINNLSNASYIQLPISDSLMLIEYINLHTELEEADTIILKGRSLESILLRRVINRTVLTGNLQTGISLLLNSNIINPLDIKRKIDNFIFTSSVDPAITNLTFNSAYLGETLYKAISEICIEKGIGFKILINSNFQFDFKLYAGKNRSHDQILLPYVTFSPKFRNLITADYYQSNEFLKTAILVGGEKGVGNKRYTYYYDASSGSITGLNLREMYKEVNDVSRNIEGGGQLTDSEYDLLLKQKGIEELAKNIFVEAFDGEIDVNNKTFIYGEDFFLGDIVQVQDNYGHSVKSRVSEIIYSKNQEGIKIYPTFKLVLE